jgi:hypothetical protein
LADRRALIITNSVTYGERSKNVPGTVVQALATDLTEQLGSLGEHAFVSTAAVDQPTSGVRDTALKTIRQAGRESATLLCYYFGHGVRSDSGDDLFLLCKDSDWREEPTMVRLGELVGWMRSYKVPAVVLILDCCHAGMISKSLRVLESYGGRYYLMASVTPKDKALVDYGDARPLGVFSKFVLAGFSNTGARVAPTRNVSFKSFFGFAESLTKRQSRQCPYSQDGGMAEDLFFKQSSEPRIVSSVRRRTPKKSLYMKIFALGTLMSTKEFGDIDQLYAFLKKVQPEQFLTPLKTDRRAVEYALVGKDALSRYLTTCERLGIIKDGEPLSLTPMGKRMFRNDGAQYNVCLYQLLVDLWSRYSVAVGDLEDIIGERLRRSSIPSGEALWFDMFLAKKLSMSKGLFTELLDLTGYVGALSLSRERTFFLAAQGDDSLTSGVHFREQSR